MLPPLLCLETLKNMCSQLKSPTLLSHFLLIYHGFWHQNIPRKHSNHMFTHITLSSLSLLQSWLFSSIMSHVTLILYHHIHVNTANLLNLTCTLVATSMILGRLEFIRPHMNTSSTIKVKVFMLIEWSYKSPPFPNIVESWTYKS
jgi:hypothetical protein